MERQKDNFWLASILAPVCIVAATAAAYWNSFQDAFVFDDELWILKNHSIRQLFPLGSVLFPDTPITSGRPLVGLSLAANYALGEYRVWGYHAVNLAIHIAAALALYALVRRTLLLPSFGNRFTTRAMPIALVAGLVWAVHPLQTAAVTYIIQRTESLMGLLYFLTLYAVVRGATTELQNSLRRVVWYCLAVTACFLGMATKEVMVSAPLMVLLYDRTFSSELIQGGAAKTLAPVSIAVRNLGRHRLGARIDPFSRRHDGLCSEGIQRLVVFTDPARGALSLSATSVLAKWTMS